MYCGKRIEAAFGPGLGLYKVENSRPRRIRNQPAGWADCIAGAVEIYAEFKFGGLPRRCNIFRIKTMGWHPIYTYPVSRLPDSINVIVAY